MKINKNILWVILVAATLPASSAHAVIQNLNSQTGSSQTFANETNIGVSSASNIHTFTWSGLLSPSRGGTGANLSSFSTSSILFWNGSTIAEDSQNLLWDDLNNFLIVSGSILFRSGG